MAIIREFNLYTNAGPSIPPVIHVNQYDRGETWKFKLYQPNGQQLTPTDAAIVGIKSDGHIIANAGTVSGGVISITETEQMTAAPGKAVFEILFDNDTHGTANFIVLVEPSPTNDGIASESDLSLFQEAIDSISPATINAAVSAWMSAQLTPSEWVIDNSLTVANAAADAKKTGDEITDLKSAIGNLSDLETESKTDLVSAINEAAQGGGSGGSGLDKTSIDLLEAILRATMYTSNQSSNITQLIEHLKSLLPVNNNIVVDGTTMTILELGIDPNNINGLYIQ